MLLGSAITGFVGFGTLLPKSYNGALFLLKTQGLCSGKGRSGGQRLLVCAGWEYFPPLQQTGGVGGDVSPTRRRCGTKRGSALWGCTQKTQPRKKDAAPKKIQRCASKRGGGGQRADVNPCTENAAPKGAALKGAALKGAAPKGAAPEGAAPKTAAFNRTPPASSQQQTSQIPTKAGAAPAAAAGQCKHRHNRDARAGRAPASPLQLQLRPFISRPADQRCQ